MSSSAFKVYGPFEIENKEKIYDREFQKAFWSTCVEAEEDNYELSEAKGIYLFSLRNATNYSPQYVGMTCRDFRTEVFNDRNLLRIITTIAKDRGLCLHLLARPKDVQRGFSKDAGNGIRGKISLPLGLLTLLVWRSSPPSLSQQLS